MRVAFARSSLARRTAPALVLRRPSTVAIRTISTSCSHHQDTSTNSATKQPVFPFAQRLKDGRALALDVWSVFK